jgi:hypothetical protein
MMAAWVATPEDVTNPDIAGMITFLVIFLPPGINMDFTPGILFTVLGIRYLKHFGTAHKFFLRVVKHNYLTYSRDYRPSPKSPRPRRILALYEDGYLHTQVVITIH